MMLVYLKEKRGILLGLALAAMTVLAYWPAIKSGGFIWDDEAYVTQNETLRDAEGLIEIWTNPRATPQYYPLVHATYWLEYRLWKLDPAGYHVTNVLLHALAAILIWLVLRRLDVPGSWLAAALFAVHPVHVESVAWITERKNVLSGVFYLLAALTYLKWDTDKHRETSRLGGYILAIFLYICALLSKTVTSTLPAALLLVIWWKEGFSAEPIPGKQLSFHRQAWRRTRPLAPFFLIGLAFSCLTIWLEVHHVGARGDEWNFTILERFLIAGRAIWFYAAKLAWPTQLIFNYPRWQIDVAVWWQYLYPISFIALLALLWAARKRIDRGPLAAVLFFAGTLTPALGFFDVYPMRYSFVADHFQYHASIGLFALAAAVITRGWQCVTERRRSLIRPFGLQLPAAVLLIILGTLTWEQCSIYRSREALWLDTIRKNPASWMAYNNLGKLYVKEGRAEEAIPLLENALRNSPDMVMAYRNLGTALAESGRMDEAMVNLNRALEIDPKDAQTYNIMGAALAREEKFADAVSCYLKALEITPDIAMTHSDLGSALGRIGRFEEAIKNHQKAVALMPSLGLLYLNYGKTMHAMGRILEAGDHYRTAVSLDASLAGAYINLGQIAAADRLPDAAIDYFRKAVEVSPHLAAAHRHLANALAAVDELEEAAKYFLNAMRLNPDSILIRTEYAETLNRLGVSSASEGRTAAALDFLRRASEVMPENAEYHNNLGVILVRIGKRNEALTALEEAIRLKPDYTEAQNNLHDLRRLMADKKGNHEK